MNFSSSPPRTSSPPPARSNLGTSPAGTPSNQPRRSNISSHRSTPHRSPHIQAISRQYRPRQVVHQRDGDVEMGTSEIDASEVIWGTNVNTTAVSQNFKKFFREYNKEGRLVYMDLIEDLVESQASALNLDCNNVREFDQRLYSQLIRYPSEVVPIIDATLNEIAMQEFPEQMAEMEDELQISARPFHLHEIKSMRDMNPSDIETLVSIRGMIIRNTSIIPDIQIAYFRCMLCHFETTVEINMGRIAEPTKCGNESCQGVNTMEIIHNRCTFTDKQLVKVQETPESIPDGDTPQTIDVYVFESLVDLCKPGDRVEITGVYRANGIRSNPRQRTIEAVYKTFLDAVHIKKSGKSHFSVESAQVEEKSDFFTPFEETDESVQLRREKIEKIKRLGAKSDIYELLVRSLAPSVWEMDDIKKGILCQLFGSTKKDFTKHGGGKFRNQLNVLLCGDPGTSKSQLLQYVHKIAPRGIYTSGKGSSAVGLTAYITKDAESGDLVLESGALVLSDRGICCIDEFDKMSDSARSILHEVMEQQTVSIAKAGIICTLNARTSILAAANPIESRYNPNKPVVENIDLPPTLISRFDLIYLVLDKPNEILDKRLAKHLVSLYYDDRERAQVSSEILDQQTLMEYITYSRREINPTLSDAACERLIEGYVDMRNIGRQTTRGRKVISATPRQLESLIRISEALARMKHSSVVTGEDVEEAIRLQRVALLRVATDPRTGTIDLDMLASGRTAAESEELKERATKILQILKNIRKRTLRMSQLLIKYNRGLESDQQLLKSGLAKAIEYLEKLEKIRMTDRLNEDPMLTVLDTGDF